MMTSTTVEAPQPHRRRSSVVRLALSIRRTASGSNSFSLKPEKPELQYGPNAMSIMDTGRGASDPRLSKGKQPIQTVDDRLRAFGLEEETEDDPVA
jgi:hypothetical protein